MSTTQRVAVALMHSQDRNLLAHIFGGHLLRSAYELAYGSALLHGGCHAELLGCSDVSFQQPVPIGCLLEFRAKVGVYREKGGGEGGGGGEQRKGRGRRCSEWR
jgi:acyl-coenzyme A thioesterase 9